MEQETPNKIGELKQRMNTKISGEALLVLLIVIAVGVVARIYFNKTISSTIIITGIAVWAGKFLRMPQKK